MSRVALLIGVSQNQLGLPPLSRVADVPELQRVLQRPELRFDTVGLLIDRPLAELKSDLERCLRECQVEDQLYLVFAGYAIQTPEQQLAFVAADTRTDSQGHFHPSTALGAAELREMLTACPAMQQVVILDCVFREQLDERSPTVENWVDPWSQLGGQGRTVMTASTLTQHSVEPENLGTWSYLRYIAEGIETGAADPDNNGTLSADDLHAYAKSKLLVAAPGVEPEIYGEASRQPLLEVPMNVPALNYRKVLERMVRQGHEVDPTGLSLLTGRSQLDEAKQELGLSDQEAVEIESQTLRPVWEYRQRQRVYRDEIERLATAPGLAEPEAQEELLTLQKSLFLGDRAAEDLDGISRDAVRAKSPRFGVSDDRVSLYQEELTQPMSGEPAPSSMASTDEAGMDRPWFLANDETDAHDDMFATTGSASFSENPSLTEPPVPTEVLSPASGSSVTELSPSESTVVERPWYETAAPMAGAAIAGAALAGGAAEAASPAAVTVPVAGPSIEPSPSVSVPVSATVPVAATTGGTVTAPVAPPPSGTVAVTMPAGGSSATATLPAPSPMTLPPTELQTPEGLSQTEIYGVQRAEPKGNGLSNLLIPLFLLGLPLAILLGAYFGGGGSSGSFSLPRITWFDPIFSGGRARSGGNNPGAVARFNTYGVTKAQRGDVKDAIAEYEKAIQLNPNNPVTYVNRGVAYNRLNNLNASQSDYDKALDLHTTGVGKLTAPQLAVLYNNRSHMYFERKDFSNAFNDANRAVALNPNLAIAHVNLANARVAQGNAQAALQDYNRAQQLGLDKKFLAGFHNDRGNAYLALNNVNAGVQDYNQALRYDTNYAHAFFNRGLAFQMANDRTQAMNDFREAARLYTEQGDGDLSRDAADRATELEKAPLDKPVPMQ